MEIKNTILKNSILIVDDDPALLKMAGEILRGNYNISSAKSGKQAVELLKSGCLPDIILLDIDMPEMDGFMTFDEIKKIESAKYIPVIFLTGITQSEAELQGISSGAVDYIKKPFVKEILLARLKVHLENGKKLRQLIEMERNKIENGIDKDKFEIIAKDLTETERKIALLVVLGYTNQEIGEYLSYSYNYVKKIVGVIFEKCAVSKRSELKKMCM